MNPIAYVALVVTLGAAGLPARAEVWRAKHASVMCSSAGALAKLALPNGGSQASGDHVPPAITKIADAGGCIKFPAGQVVILEKNRGHTSIVRTDSGSGDGVMTDVLAANIDFAPYEPPHSPFYDTIRSRCPNLLDGIAAEDAPTNDFVQTLPPATRHVINQTAEDNCGTGSCQTRTRADEIQKRHLEGQWASYLCAHPTTAVEPLDRSPSQIRD